jgi:hypothetical protein
MLDWAYVGSNLRAGQRRGEQLHGRWAVLGMTRASPYWPPPEDVMKPNSSGFWPTA